MCDAQRQQSSIFGLHCNEGVKSTTEKNEELLKIFNGLIVYGSDSLLSLADIDSEVIPSFEAGDIEAEEDSVAYFEALAHIRRTFAQATRLKMFSFREYSTRLVDHGLHSTNWTSRTYHLRHRRELMLQSQALLVSLCVEFMRRFHL